MFTLRTELTDFDIMSANAPNTVELAGRHFL